jgi:hypothetical protein
MAMARSKVFPPASKMAFLCALLPVTVSEPRSSLLLESSAVGEPNAVRKITGRRVKKDLMIEGEETRLLRTVMKMQ